MAGQRYAEEVESAAYFVASEALANVLKHANATHVGVRLSQQDGLLRIEVRDDGSGLGAAASNGSGLGGLADRVDAVGGRLTVRSDAGMGTTVRADLLLREGGDG